MNDHPLEKIIRRAELAIRDHFSSASLGKFWVTHYGATDINPKHLVIWLCVSTDALKAHLLASNEYRSVARQSLLTAGYPAEVCGQIHVGVESEETVNRESGGNWWHHWK